MPLACLRAWTPIVLSALLAACRVGVAQGPDRPDELGALGPPPPPDFQCEHGARSIVDIDHDGRGDIVLYTLGSSPLCRGEDSNKDGRVDRWLLMRNDKPVEEHADTDHDGVLDRRSRDKDGDGVFDETTTLALPPRDAG